MLMSYSHNLQRPVLLAAKIKPTTAQSRGVRPATELLHFTLQLKFSAEIFFLSRKIFLVFIEDRWRLLRWRR